jgi:hypothetical protein
VDAAHKAWHDVFFESGKIVTPRFIRLRGRSRSRRGEASGAARDGMTKARGVYGTVANIEHASSRSG